MRKTQRKLWKINIDNLMPKKKKKKTNKLHFICVLNEEYFSFRANNNKETFVK